MLRLRAACLARVWGRGDLAHGARPLRSGQLSPPSDSQPLGALERPERGRGPRGASGPCCNSANPEEDAYLSVRAGPSEPLLPTRWPWRTRPLSGEQEGPPFPCTLQII